jgi:hypothetical protein
VNRFLLWRAPEPRALTPGLKGVLNTAVRVTIFIRKTSFFILNKGILEVRRKNLELSNEPWTDISLPLRKE